MLKAPQQVVARRLRRKVDGRWTYIDNPDYLDAGLFTKQFLEPAQGKLGAKLAGIILEQPYERAGDSPAGRIEFVAEWGPVRLRDPERHAAYHLEVRSSHQLTPPYLEWLANREIGFCFSHWQWLPPIVDQWRLVAEHFSSSSASCNRTADPAPRHGL